MDNKRERRPNVLLITCDQWRGDSIGAAGQAPVLTPNADALAREGVLFTRHYGGAAPCSPARACLYTGLYQMNNRVCRNGTPMDRRFGNLALAARHMGYDPTLFGYTDVSPDPRYFAPGDPVLRTYEGVLPGFSARQMLPEHQKPWLSWLAMRGVKTGTGFPDIHTPATGVSKIVSRAPPVYASGETPAAFLTDEFLRWMGEQDPAENGGSPWFAHISYLSPHPPFITPEPYNMIFCSDDGPSFRRARTWQDEAALHPYVAHELSSQKRKKFIPGLGGKVRTFSDVEFRTIRAIYRGMIAEVDSQLGRVWQGLKDRSAWRDTLIVLTSDHAEMMGDHYMLGKGGFFDQSYHIPLVVRDPRRRGSRGTIVDRFTEAIDIMPTLLELIGAPPRPYLDGHSLRPFLDGKNPTGWRNSVHWEFDFRSISNRKQPFGLSQRQCNLSVIRKENHKYIHFGGGLPPLLFDLANDPDELVNRATDPAFQAMRIQLAEELLAWRAEHLDQSLALSELTENGVVGRYARLTS